MFDKFFSFKIIRLMGLLPVSFDHDKKVIISKMWYFVSCVLCVVGISGTGYRLYYVLYAAEYQSENDHIGYIFDVLLKIEPIIIIIVVGLIYHRSINYLALKEQVEFLNALTAIINPKFERILLKKDRNATIFVIICMVFTMGSMAFVYLRYGSLMDIDSHLDFILDTLETVVVSIQSFNFLIYFSIFYVIIVDLEKIFLYGKSNNFQNNEKKFVEICLNKYDTVLNIITQFTKIHGLAVKVLVTYAYFDIVVAIKGLLDLFAKYSHESSSLITDIVTVIWYLCHIPYIFLFIYLGEEIENKVFMCQNLLNLFQ